MLGDVHWLIYLLLLLSVFSFLGQQLLAFQIFLCFHLWLYLVHRIPLIFASISLCLIIRTILFSFRLLLPPLSTSLLFLHTMALLWRRGIRAGRRGRPGQLTSPNDAAGFYKKVLLAAESMLLLPSLSNCTSRRNGFCATPPRCSVPTLWNESMPCLFVCVVSLSANTGASRLCRGRERSHSWWSVVG